MFRSKWALAILISVGAVLPSQSAPLPKALVTAKLDAEFEEIWDSVTWYRPDGVKLWCRINANPKAGFAFLERKVAPVRLDKIEAKRLIDDLGSEDEKVWRAAENRLRKRDIRLAMNFLDAWEYAKSDSQRQRLASVVYLKEEFPQYFDATLVKNRPLPGEQQTYLLTLHLNPNVTKDQQLQFGLHVGSAINLDPAQLSLPGSRGSTAEYKLIEYLVKSRGTEADVLIDRLAQGHPEIEATRLACATIKSRTEVKPRHLSERLTPDTLPALWEDWGRSDRPDALTQKMLSDPATTIAFLRSRMKPIRATALQCGLLLTLLAHPSEEVWNKARTLLRRADPRFCLPVEQLWQLAKTPDQQRRVAELFWFDPETSKYMDYELTREGIGNRSYWSLVSHIRKDIPPEHVPESVKGQAGSGMTIFGDMKYLTSILWFREEAAIWILEAIGTDDAIAIVRSMAGGHPDARPTVAAQEVLARRRPK